MYDLYAKIEIYPGITFAAIKKSALVLRNLPVAEREGFEKIPQGDFEAKHAAFVEVRKSEWKNTESATEVLAHRADHTQEEILNSLATLYNQFRGTRRPDQMVSTLRYFLSDHLQ